MKRMYITLSVIFIAIVWAFGALSQMTDPQAQQQPFDRMKRRMELREEMHRRIREKLLTGRGDDQNLFKDLEQEFEDTMSDSFSGLEPSYKSEWIEDKNGRTLVITPKDPNQKINIDVNASVITIKGESQEKTATTSMVSAFSNTFPVPDDCDGTKVKMNSKDGKLLVELPYKKLKSNQRTPISPIPGEVEI